MKRNKTFCFIIILLICFVSKGNGQDAVKIARLSAQVEFDGYPYEEAWNGLEYFSLTMNRPNFGNEPSERSEVMIAYDDEFLWIGARLFMQDVTKIFAASKRRDEQLFGFDSFGILLDTYDDNENGLAFFTAPTGLRTDYAVSNDAAGGGGGFFSSMNYSWNTFWDVETSKDDKGWYVEMRIPFSSLKFKPENDIATMGLIIVRNISVNNETDTWPAIDPRYGFMATNKPSLASNIEIEGTRSKNPVYISPYVIGGFSRDRIPNTDTTAFVNDDNWEKNIGGDIKYNINSNLTLDITVNTDFAQVEADNQQVNLTRYSLYFPEKRMFFQERSSLFNFSLGGRSDDLFYSRRIGLSDNFEPIRIYGGLRLAGRIGNWDMGFLDMQTEEHGTAPGENFGVIRMRRQVINPNSYVGGMFTSRLGMDGSQNFAYGLDGIFRFLKDDYFSVKWAQSYDKVADTIPWNFIENTFVMANMERRSEKGFAYDITWSRSGTDFNPGIGFIQRPGLWGIMGRFLYGWLPGEESKLFNYAITFNVGRFERLEDHHLESFEMGPGFEINTKRNYGIEFSIQYSKEDVSWGYNITDSIEISPGLYEQLGIRGDLRMPDSKKVTARIEFEAGGFYDGLKYSLGLDPMLNISPSLQVSGGYGIDIIRFPKRESNNEVTIHNINGRVLYMMNTKLSVSLLVQYVNTQDELITNFRLRYNPREGNDFYLVFNENRNFNPTTTIHDNFPSMGYKTLDTPSFFNRTIMLKYTHTFRL